MLVADLNATALITTGASLTSFALKLSATTRIRVKGRLVRTVKLFTLLLRLADNKGCALWRFIINWCTLQFVESGIGVVDSGARSFELIR